MFVQYLSRRGFNFNNSGCKPENKTALENPTPLGLNNLYNKYFSSNSKSFFFFNLKSVGFTNGYLHLSPSGYGIKNTMNYTSLKGLNLVTPVAKLGNKTNLRI